MISYVPTDSLAGQALDVVIVGAGIIGIACAHKLQQSGRRVTLIERDGVACGASFGNAGAFAYSDILPLAASGKLRQVPNWLMDPLGPLSIPPAYLFRVLPWLVRFWRAGWPDRARASVQAQIALMRLAAIEMTSMIQACGLEHMVRGDGSLELYANERELAAASAGWHARAEANIAFEHVRGSRLAELQPGLAREFVAGTFVPAWQTVSDPYEFACALADRVQEKGGVFTRARVAAVRPTDDGALVSLDGGNTLAARTVVIAAGAWAGPLVKPLGDHIPLETERGYNTTLPPNAFDLRRQLIFGAHGFVVTPLSTGIRIGGAVELGGLDLAPNYTRSEAMLTKAARFLPGLATAGGKQWMGFRPSLPDSLPVIGPSRASSRIIHAFGHGHLGLTQCAATGRLVADLVCGRNPAIELSSFSPQRF
ncbi:MAG: FAD-binding oxidoreductase [Variovorax sp.]